MRYVQESMIDKALCAELIELFKKEYKKNQTQPGMAAKGDGNRFVDHNVKTSTDMNLCMIEDPSDMYNVYGRYQKICDKLRWSIFAGFKKYIAEFDQLEGHSEFQIDASTNLQWYKPGESYGIWHCENSGGHGTKRLLAFLIYLNDVTDGGGTEFKYPKGSVSAETGKMIFFPVGFTHTHRGVPSPTQDKYIIAGWCSFVNQEPI